ncbi:MAG TPA: hypothetical protein VIH14_05955 [Anaerolineales bacterium]
MNESETLCRICRQRPASSFEHVPPKGAFNDNPIRWFGLFDWLSRESNQRLVLGALRKKGAGALTLCERCNNNTGSWYAPELISWTKAGVGILQNLTPEQIADRSPDKRGAHIVIHDVYPLRFIKQIIAMMLSIHNVAFSTKHSELSEFVLDKTRRGLSPGYRFGLTLLRGPNARFFGHATRLELYTGIAEQVAEIAYPPFSYWMYIDSEEKEIFTGDITNFVDYGYEEKTDFISSLEVGFSHSYVPLDFRSKAAIEKDSGK